MRNQIAICLVLAVLGSTASAVPSSYENLYGFTGLSTNNPVNTAIGEGQLFVDVYTDADYAYFKFYNEVGERCSITNVYFDVVDGLLDVTSYVIDVSAGVRFSEGGSPGVLPGGESISFNVDFSAGAAAPSYHNGVDSADEYLIIGLALQNGASFDDVLAALNAGDITIGLHVRGFEDGGSESFVNTTAPVPEPSSVFLVAFGALAGLATLRWRGRKKTA